MKNSLVSSWKKSAHSRSRSTGSVLFAKKDESVGSKTRSKLTINRKMSLKEDSSTSKLSPSQKAKSITGILYVPQFIKDRNSPAKKYTDFQELNKKLACDPMLKRNKVRLAKDLGIEVDQPQHTLKDLVGFSSPASSRKLICSSSSSARKMYSKQKSVLYTGKINNSKNKDFNRWALIKERVLSQPQSPLKQSTAVSEKQKECRENQPLKRLSIKLPSELKEISAEPSFYESPSKQPKTAALYCRPFRFNHHERSKSEFSKQLLENLLKQQDIDIIKNFYKKLYNIKERDYTSKVKNTLGGPGMYSVRAPKGKRMLQTTSHSSPKNKDIKIESEGFTESDIDILVQREGKQYVDEIKNRLAKKRPRLQLRDRLSEALKLQWNEQQEPYISSSSMQGAMKKTGLRAEDAYFDARPFRDQLRHLERIKRETLLPKNQPRLMQLCPKS